MKVLNKFTIRSLKLNKKRTITTIIGIILSTALICGVAGLVSSTQYSLIKWTRERIGNYHVEFSRVDIKDVKTICDDDEVDEYFTVSKIGWAKLEDIQNKDKPYLNIHGYDENALKNYALDLVEGRLPQKADELLIPNHLYSNGRVDLKIGDKITLQVGERVQEDGTILNENNPYIVKENNEYVATEKLRNTREITYTIVGKINRLRSEGYHEPGYTCITMQENETDSKDVFVLLKTPKTYKEFTKRITANIKFNETLNNSELLRYQGVMSDGLIKSLYAIASVVVGIIIVASVFVIRNSFSISVVEKNKQYGMFASVGATSKQIKNNVIFEGMMIGLIAIPLGIVFGIIAIVILMNIVSMLLSDMLNFVMVYKFEPISICVATLLSIITIYLSCLIPAIKASKISPIESIRGNADIKMKSKKIKVSPIIKRLFGIGGVVASKNLKRSKKKYRTTVISIVVSVFIFIAISTFFTIGEKITNIYYTDLKYNMYVQNGTEEMYENIINKFMLKDYAYFYERNINIDEDKYLSEFGTEYYEKIGGTAHVTLTIYNDEYFAKYANQIGLKNIDLNQTAILVDELMMENEDGVKELKRVLDIGDGDILETQIGDNNHNIKITKYAEERPMGLENRFTGDAQIIISKSNFEKNLGESLAENNKLQILAINADDSLELERKINDFINSDINFAQMSTYNYDTYVAQNQKIILVVKIFLYGFITVITLIGITNIFNTITTNMILRSKEFAMLKAIGMTKKEFNRMIRLESIMYGMKSLLYGIPLGLIGSMLIQKSFEDGMVIEYSIPIEAIICSIIFVFIIVGITMKYSLGKINKQNIIDTIRTDNI